MMRTMAMTRRMRRGGALAVTAVCLATMTLATPATAAPGIPSVKAHDVVVRANVDHAQVGERIWLSVSGLPNIATVTVQKRTLTRTTAAIAPTDQATTTYQPKGKWREVGDKHQVKGGDVKLHVRVAGPAQYRVVVRGKATFKSKLVNVPTFSVNKTLEERQDELVSKLGTATTKVRTLSKTKVRKIKGPHRGVKAVRWQAFKKGSIIEVTKGDKVRSWVVLGTLGQSYRKAGGPTSSWGLPKADAQCGLLQAGCVQSFTARTAYSSTRTTSAVTSKFKGKVGEVDAAMRSWLGYRVTYANNTSTPIQKWMGSSAAWCGYFQTWGFHASGNADLLPPKKKLIPFPNMRSTAKRAMKTSSKPKIGALAFVRTQRGREAGHVGFVTAVTKTSIRLLHGNTTGNGKVPRGHRGVVETWVPRSTAAFYAYPQY